jgi:hypothetical protein
VEIRRPGQSWQAWTTTSNMTLGSFVADAGPGEYDFRSRLATADGTGSSGWSPVLHVTVSG